VTIDRVFPLSDVQQAHEVLEAGGSKGKFLFRIG
jgi:NADPH:quinone reductase-like Zn-dependent oxidoreductase